ncbi:GNAT family N-acetyltransferase [Arthrobacter echini]|uniref:GNAT family N-acetyltransferase n=1 Tax=Arthrobacter echini TaxID=1529066 RepID=A0A5D0XU47_9MICC|nr:GNAT family N-acetyltransferase [Arthrobacter echini]TYC99413.1 GNAT family N-acetyltransferase [Arthrobacter echini]
MNSADAVDISELAIPDDLMHPGAEAFEAMVEVRNRVETEILGTPALSHSAAELLPGFRNPYKPRRLFVARSGGHTVARAILSWRTVTGSPVATVNVEVRSDARGQGIGTALLERMEALARDLNLTTVQSYVTHPALADKDRVEPLSGYGSLSASDPGVRFLTRHGYALEQIKRISFLDLPLPDRELTALLEDARAQAGSAYNVVQWHGSTPEHWVADLAVLKTRMSTEEPSAGLHTTEDPWDEQRVRRRDDDQEASGRLLMTTAIEDCRTGRLIAVTEISLPGPTGGVAAQEDTLVLPGHRGHRLGMLAKAANLRQADARAPQIYTFNAEENRPMLSINEALGYRAAGYDGAWEKML